MKESPDTHFPASATSAPETLHRSLSLWNSLTIGFATVSPVAGLYAIISVQTIVTGGGWFAPLALCLVMRLLVVQDFARFSSQIEAELHRQLTASPESAACVDGSPVWWQTAAARLEIAGGSDGIFIYVRPVADLFGWQPFTLENVGHFYFVTLALFAATFAGLRVMLKSPFGRVIDGIRVNEHRMRSLGYVTFRYKLVCFVIAGGLAGLAGYLAGAQHGNVNPDMLGWHLSGSVLMMVILGGMGTLTGPIVGAFAMLLLEILFQGMTKHWQLLKGGFFVLVALFLPYGRVGLGALAVRRKVPRE